MEKDKKYTIKQMVSPIYNFLALLLFYFLLLMFIALSARRDAFSQGRLTNTIDKQSYTIITAYNPYRLGVKLEVKCDWSNKIRAFAYHQFFIIKGKKNVSITVPNQFRKCEIWPEITW